MSRRLAFTAALGLLLAATTIGGGTVGSSGARPAGTVWLAERDGDRHGRAGTVWVVNRERGEVTIFDARTGAVLDTLATGSGAHEVAIVDDADKAFITNEFANTVSVVSTRTLVTSEPIPLGPQPHHLEPSHDGDTILVGLVGTNAVAAIDVDTDRVRTFASSENRAARAHGPSLQNETIYVAHETGNEVTGIDGQTGDIEFSVGGIVQPTEVLPDRHERRLYVAARGEGKIRVIDLADVHGPVREVAVGTQPETMLLTRDQHTLVVSLRGTPARLAFVDTKSLTLTRTMELAGPGSFGDLAAMSDDGRTVYATFDRAPTGVGGVAVVDVKRRAVIDTWNYPEVGRIHGVAFSTDRPL